MKKVFALLLCLLLVNGVVSVSYSKAAETPASIKVIGGGLKKGVFFTPTYLNVEQQRIYVSDTVNNRVQAFIRGNVFQLSFGSFGQNQGQFDKVGGIASAQDKLFIVDSGNNRIQIFDSKAVYLGQFDGLLQPSDICTDGNSLFILNSGAGNIIQTDLTGKILNKFLEGVLSKKCYGLDVFESTLVVTDTTGHIFIYDLIKNKLVSDITVIKSPLGIKIIDKQIYVCDLSDKLVRILSMTGEITGVIRYETMTSPVDVSELDNKIIISDTANHRVMQFTKNGQFYGLLGMEYDNKNVFVHPIAVSKSENSFMVLDSYLKVIQIYNNQGQLVMTCDASEAKNPSAIFNYNNLSFLLDKETSTVFAHDEFGKQVYKWGSRGSAKGQLLNPEDLAVFDNNVYIADTGNKSVKIFKLNGQFISEFSSNEIAFAKSIAVTQNKIYIADSIRNQILVFDYQGKYLRDIGHFGQELGSFFGLNSISLDNAGNLYCADTYNNRIQIINTRTLQVRAYGNFGSIFTQTNIAKGEKDIDYSILPGRFSFPTDVVFLNDNIIVVDSANQRVQQISINEVFVEDIIRVSTSTLDFGSPSDVLEQAFVIYSENGRILNGSVTTSDPSILADVQIFQSAYQEIFIKLLQPVSGEVTVTINDKKYIVIVKANNTRTQDFIASVPPINIAEGKIEIPITVINQNGFEGQINYTPLSVPKNTSIVVENNTIIVKPSGRFVAPGTYLIKMQASAKNNTHEFESILVIQDRQELVPHTVLVEMFTAVWCGNCPYAVLALERLLAEMGLGKFIPIQFYVDSTDDHPRPALSSYESKARMSWYMNDQGIPDTFFDGTDHIKGVPTGGDSSNEGKTKTLYDSYKKKIIELGQNPSILSIKAQNSLDSATNTGTCTASITALDNIPFKDIRVYFALIENDIYYKAINGDKIHNFVLRDFITPKNDDATDYLGTPIKLVKGGTHSITVSYPIKDIYNIDNLQMVVYVQDNITKKVIQAFQTDVKTITQNNFALVGKDLYQRRAIGEVADFTLHLYNLGSKIDVITGNFAHSKTPIAPSSGLEIKKTIQVPDGAKVGDIIKETVTATNSQNISKTIEYAVEVISSRPPDFQLKLQSEIEVTAGITKDIDVRVYPDPVFTDKVELSIINRPETMNINWTINNEVPLFQSILSINFPPTTPDTEYKITVQAKSGNIIKTVDVVVKVKKNVEYVAPYLEIATPNDNSISNKTKIIITGSTDASSLTINDANVEVKDSTFEYVFSLKEGKNIIKLIASNAKGLKTEKTLTLTLDTIKPLLTIDQLPTNSFSETISVNGISERDIFVGYIVNTIDYNIPDSLTPIIINADGRFSVQVTLVKGWNTINIHALDKAGNQADQIIDIWYATKIILQIGNKVATINDKDILLEAPPYITKGRTMIPFRFIGESVGAKVNWDAPTRSIVLELNDTTLRMTVGSLEAWSKELGQVGETRIILEVAPEIKSGRTFVPLRFISEFFEFVVDWNAKLQQVTLSQLAKE